jgi:MFS family permease
VSAARRLDLVVLLNFLGIGILIAEVPRYLHDELRAGRGAVGSATTLFFLAALIARPFVGRAIDRVGRRRFVIWPLPLLAVAAASFELTTSVVSVAGLRFLQGLVGACFFTSSATMAADLAPPERRASAIARLSFNIYIGFVVGPLAADLLIDHGHGWARMTAAGLHLAGWALAVGLPESRQPQAPPVAGGAADLPARVRSFQPAVVRPGVALLSVAFGFASIAAFAPEYAERLGIARPGTLFAVYAAAVMASRSVTGPLADKIGSIRVALPAIGVGALGLLLMALSNQPALSYVGIALVGCGSGSTFPALSSFAISRVTDAERGTAMSSFLMFNDLGQALSGPLVGFIAQQAGFRWVYGIPAAVAVLGALALVAPSPRRQPARAPA